MIPSKAACVLCFKACVPGPALAIAAADVGAPPPTPTEEGGGFVPVIPAFVLATPPGNANTYIGGG